MNERLVVLRALVALALLTVGAAICPENRPRQCGATPVRRSGSGRALQAELCGMSRGRWQAGSGAADRRSGYISPLSMTMRCGMPFRREGLVPQCRPLRRVKAEC